MPALCLPEVPDFHSKGGRSLAALPAPSWAILAWGTAWRGNVVLDRIPQNAVQITYGFLDSTAAIPAILPDISKYLFGDVNSSGLEEFAGMRRFSCL